MFHVYVFKLLESTRSMTRSKTNISSLNSDGSEKVRALA